MLVVFVNGKSYYACAKMKRIVKWLPLVVVAVGVVSYVNSFSAPFIFDDFDVVTNSPEISRIFPLTLKSRFLFHLSFKINYAVGGLNHADYHAVNLMIHIAAGLFLFGIVKRTLMLPAMMRIYGDAAPIIAAVCAAVWTAHPLQTESVTYIAQRCESMMGLFYFMAVYCFARAAQSPHKRHWHDLCLAACALGMGTKETMATAPVVILLYDYVFASKSFRQLLRDRWRAHISLFATWGIMAFLWLRAVSSNIEAGFHTVGRTPALTYFLTQMGVITHYLRLAIFPHPLCLDYGWPAVEAVSDALAPGLFIALLGALTLWGLRRCSAPGFLGAWFFITLAPTSSFIPIDDMAFEHRMYLPLAAPVILLITLGDGALKRLCAAARAASGSATATRVIAGILLLGGLSVCTLMRNADYRSEDAMWRSLMAARPDNLRARLSMGVALLKQGRRQEAEEHFTTILARLPTINQSSSSEDVTLYSKTQNAMGIISFLHGDYDAAERRFREAIRPAYENVNALNNLGAALKRQGRAQEAVKQWYEALRLSPDDPNAHYHLGSHFTNAGRYNEAIKHLDAAIISKPDMMKAALDLAWLLATCEDESLHDGERSMQLAQRVRTVVGGESVRALDVMGAASARIGKFDDAVRYAESAISVGEERGMTGLNVIEDRLNLYRQGIPYLSKKSNPVPE